MMMMENIDDSGFDSDHKSGPNTSLQSQETADGDISTDGLIHTPESSKSVHKTSDLQKKIEKQRGKTRRKPVVEIQPKRSFLLPRSRLNIPVKQSVIPPSGDQQPLVAIMSDDSDDDEFDVPRLSKEAQKEITEQLIKDGYDLDLEPDDEDLDLIPIRPLHERCFCCPSATWIPGRCAIQ